MPWGLTTVEAEGYNYCHLRLARTRIASDWTVLNDERVVTYPRARVILQFVIRRSAYCTGVLNIIAFKCETGPGKMRANR